jgi:hypothetical protein
MLMSTNRDYNTDFVLWARDQAALLRAGRFDELDVENLAEEVDSIAHDEVSELVSRLAHLMQHLFQWEHWPDARVPVWYVVIVGERNMIPPSFEDSPSLVGGWSRIYARAWGRARLRVSSTMDISISLVPEECPYGKDELLSLTFWPGGGETP